MIEPGHLALKACLRESSLLLPPHCRQLYAGVCLHSTLDSFSSPFMGNTSSDLAPQVMHCMSGESWSDGML